MLSGNYKCSFVRATAHDGVKETPVASATGAFTLRFNVVKE